MSKKVTNKDLYDFCTLYRQQFGKIHDATRFYFQHPNPSELFNRCLEQKFIVHDSGNIIIKVKP